MNSFKVLSILFLILSFSGCGYFTPTKEFSEYRDKVKGGIYESYDEAVTRMHVERIQVEEQYIELQKEMAEMKLAYQIVTGLKPDEVMNSSEINDETFHDIEDYFDRNKVERILKIRQSYDDFSEVVTKQLLIDENLTKTVSSLEDKRRQILGTYLRSIAWGVMASDVQEDIEKIKKLKTIQNLKEGQNE